MLTSMSVDGYDETAAHSGEVAVLDVRRFMIVSSAMGNARGLVVPALPPQSTF